MAEPDIIQVEEPEQGVRQEATIWAAPRHTFEGFIDFIRERGVSALAIGFILGGAAQQLVQALMNDIINPFIGTFLTSVQTLSAYTVGVFKVGDFISVLINFFILCFLVYLLFRSLHLERFDKPKK